MKGEFENATWAWAFLALVMYPLVPTSWATALMGCVNKDLPFVPTVLTQLACSFLNLITPNGIGGTALQIDYLHKQDVPVASAGSAMVLSTGVGGAIQMILFLTAAAITATAVDTSSSSDSSSGTTTLWIIVAVAVVIGIVLAIPKLKNKVVPAVKRAASDIWAVVRNPKKALQLVGGDTAGNLIYPLILGVCLLAFHQHLDFAQLVVVQVGAGMVGNVAPVPGGIGVTEAALTAGLTSFGIPPAPALATRAPVPGHHVPDPADLRVLHAALAPRQGLRVGRSARERPTVNSVAAPGPPLRVRRRREPSGARRDARGARQPRRAVERSRVRGRRRARVRLSSARSRSRSGAATLPVGHHAHETVRAVLELVFGVALLVGGAYVWSQPAVRPPKPNSRSRRVLERLAHLNLPEVFLAGAALALGPEAPRAHRPGRAATISAADLGRDGEGSRSPSATSSSPPRWSRVPVVLAIVFGTRAEAWMTDVAAWLAAHRGR